MTIGYIQPAPTQIDVPFFRYVSSVLDDDLKVIYTRPDGLIDDIFDSEVGRRVSWGIDLLGGYPHTSAPLRRQRSWLVRELQRERYRFLVISGYREPLARWAAALGKLLSIPIAMRLDTPAFQGMSRPRRSAKKALYMVFRRLYDHFLPVGASAADFLAGVGVKPDQMSVLPYTVDLDRYRRLSRLTSEERRQVRVKHNLPLDAPVVVAVTKFHEREAPWDLLHAQCAMRDPSAWLWLIGDGPERPRLEEYVRARKCDSVVFAGYVPYQELPLAYGAADAFAHPARYEPWGVSVQEALACGLPVLASSMVGAGRDFVTPGRNGFIYRAGDPDDLRRKLPLLLDLVGSTDARGETERLLAKSEYPVLWQTLRDLAERLSS